ncbi:MAG: hypothetical protein IJV13_03195 [Prevotella sp.]|nr:hypothetical protein [Prevotella sp.]
MASCIDSDLCHAAIRMRKQASTFTAAAVHTWWHDVTHTNSQYHAECSGASEGKCA